MTRSEWKEMLDDLLDGVERELRSSAPIKTKLALNVFRKRLGEGRVARRRKQFEQELEAFLQSEPFLRGAAKRYLRKKARAVVEKALRLVSSRVLHSRKARADFKAFDKLMRRRGGKRPRAGDELPPRAKEE